MAAKRGSDGLATILLFVAFLVLARVRNPEALRHQSPGEWGAIWGLDRCPKVNPCLRRKIKDPGRNARQVRNWQASLTQTCAARQSS